MCYVFLIKTLMLLDCNVNCCGLKDYKPVDNGNKLYDVDKLIFLFYELRRF